MTACHHYVTKCCISVKSNAFLNLNVWMQYLFIIVQVTSWILFQIIFLTRESTNINDGFNFNTKTPHSSWFLTSCILTILFFFCLLPLHCFVFTSFGQYYLLEWQIQKCGYPVSQVMKNVSSIIIWHNFGLIIRLFWTYFLCLIKYIIGINCGKCN